ncbi:hypothetical protein ACE5JW_01370 [Acinetobacter radioresistens]|jgi:hypothetical protein|uniref:Uncharacterized protein n=1 Tax=Acinetobacter radioresistens SK82 TaxID=596318 RepID=A0ABP2GNR2_ACIRA|nr:MULTISPECIES: hypothetical protein [Acinetobacter]EET82968.1 hypothetical protein ACIRA0001_2127 [Acinetobacter radioresistens SK82]EEY86626.1 hypothetical protein HMPREF0018_01199 [Acinetobacter radioresistens SH164]ENV85207.1 hypothetical protein F940_02342 [Acinetobacter radioresistens NIPH 2130]EXB86963.1 hypothetical protein J538_1096 [Acinetobacter sp. 272263]EXC33166.1 hypothetical protein J520_1180 [Acinetobacter sp. 869535]
MSNPLEGLQFPVQEGSNKPSTTRTGKEIIAEALSLVDSDSSQQASKEKNWRKTYPKYFKALVYQGIRHVNHPITIAKQGLHKAHHSFVFYRAGESCLLKDVMQLPVEKQLYTAKFQGKNDNTPEWYVPYHGQNLQGQSLLSQIEKWLAAGIIEASHAEALQQAVAHPEWFDLSDRTLVLLGAGSEAGPLTWLAKWKANIVAIDLPRAQVWERILNIIEAGNATLIAPSDQPFPEQASISELKEHLGANLLTQLPEIGQWLVTFKQQLDLAAIAYLDGEKHVRVSMAMDAIMQYVSQHKPDTSLMFMCTPTDVYAVPEEVAQAASDKFKHRSQLQKLLTKGISTASLKHFFQKNQQMLVKSDNGKHYGITDCLVLEQGPNYALAKRLQQWRAVLARHQGQQVSINIAPSTTTHSVTKNPLLKAAFTGASLFDVEAFAPETTNAIMAALWIHDLRNPDSAAHPDTALEHPLELMMEGANHGGLWRVAYLARTALPFAALYGLASDKLPVEKLLSKFKKKS